MYLSFLSGGGGTAPVRVFSFFPGGATLHRSTLCPDSSQSHAGPHFLKVPFCDGSSLSALSYPVGCVSAAARAACQGGLA